MNVNKASKSNRFILVSITLIKFKTIKGQLIATFAVIIFIIEFACLYPLISYQEPLEKYDNALDNVTNLSEIKKVCDTMMYYLYQSTKSMKIVDFEDNKLREDTKVDIDKISKTLGYVDKKIVDKKSRSALDGLINLVAKYNQNCSNAVLADKSIPYEKRVEFYKNAKQMSEYITGQIFEVTAAEMDYSRILREQVKKTTARIIVCTIILNLALLALSILGSYLIASRISKSIGLIAKGAGKVAKGDLTQSEIIIKTNDELSYLANSFNEMIANLKEMISMVRASSDSVLYTAERLSNSAIQSSSACEQIASSMQDVATGAKNQLDISMESSSALEKMYLISQKIAKKSTEARSTSKNAHEAAEYGNQSVKDVVDQMNFINETVKDTFVISEELSRKSADIGKIVDVIKTITNQTNLLSLNASIEAARAGEHGRGFAVVADEIRKLAVQTSDAASQITNIVKNIQQQTNKMSDSMRTGIGEINKGISITGKAGESFSKIKNSISEVNNRVSDIDDEIAGINCEIGKIRSYGKNTLNISKISADNSEQVAASVEELTASMQEVLSTSTVLNQMANDLKGLVDKFTM